MEKPEGFERWRDVVANLGEANMEKFLETLTREGREELAKMLRDEALEYSRENINDYISVVEPDIVPALHHNLILKNLTYLANGTISRLMIFAPPGSAKSTYGSVLFPSWAMGRERLDYIGAAHTDELATDFSKRVRRVVDTPEWRDVFNWGKGEGEIEKQPVGLDPDTRSAGHWRLLNGSQYYAVGVGGAIAGRRADIGSIDDPIKSRKDSLSAAYKRELWNWYLSDFRPRIKPYPHGRILIFMTRWMLDDLPGRILECEDRGADNYYDGRSGWYWDKLRQERWLVINLPAIAESGDVLKRKEGEPLWPEWFTEDHFKREKALLGAFNFSALFQGTPIPSEGGMFRREWFKVVRSGMGLGARRVRYWDTASTLPKPGYNDPDFTVGIRLAMEDGRFCVEEMERFRGTPGMVKQRVAAVAEREGSGVRIYMEQEPGSAGVAVIEDYARNVLRGYNFRGDKGTGSKIDRADNHAAAAENGLVSLVNGPWNGVFLDEHETFPMGAHDDIVDATSGAHNKLAIRKRAGAFGRR